MHIAKINKHPDFNIWGTGSPKREFLHVDDLANAIFHLIDTETNEKLLNIGSGREVTIKDLAKKIQDVVGYEGEVSFDSKMPDGNPRKLLDSNLISSLGWKPSIDLEEGLDSTYKWFLKNLS
jgi:GDP-L-fucose synthase